MDKETHPLLTLDDLSRYLRLTKRTIYKLLSGGLPAVRPRGHLRFRLHDVEKWLQAKLYKSKEGKRHE